MPQFLKSGFFFSDATNFLSMGFINTCICVLTTVVVFNSLKMSHLTFYGMLLDPSTSKGPCVGGIVDWPLKRIKGLETLGIHIICT